MMENLFINKSIYDTVDTLEKYKYSGKIFTNKYVMQFLVVLLTNLTSLILITIDGFVAAHFIGEDALNSVNLLNPFILIMGAVTIFLAGGVNIVLSKTYGIGSEELKQKIFRAIVLLTVIFMIGETIVQIPISYFMINSYMVDQGIKSMMKLYVIGMIITNTVSIINTVCSYIFIASGKTKILLKLAILESSLHIAFDLFFVAGLNMGILGAGIGTAISCTIRGIVSIMLVQKVLKIFPIAKVGCRTEMRDILYNGFPLMVRQLLISLAVYAINMYIALCDSDLEAITVISVCAFGGSVAIMIVNSFVQASNSIIGILVGSADWEIVRDLGKKILYISVATINLFVLIFVLFPQILFKFYGINDYTNFQLNSVKMYMLRFITFAIICNLSNMCIYCEKQKISIIANVLEAILVVPIAVFLEKLNQDLIFLCYVFSGIVPIAILAFTLSKTFKKKIEDDKMLCSRIHFCFKGSEANEVSEKLYKYLVENNVVKKIAFRLSLACEELGVYAAKDGNDKELNIYFLVKIYKELLHIFYLDDSGPAILNKKLKGTDLILGNYNLLESFASEFSYQNVSGYNIFIIKFNL